MMTVKTYRIVYHKDCGACRYVQRRYVRLSKRAYHAMDDGHCMKRRIRRHTRAICPDWKGRVPPVSLLTIPCGSEKFCSTMFDFYLTKLERMLYI